MGDGKYVIFKQEEFDKWYTDILQAANPMAPPPIEDGVVIRRQDVFAPPALDAYANSIQIALSIGAVNETHTSHLRKVADFFHQQAVLSWNANRKLPD